MFNHLKFIQVCCGCRGRGFDRELFYMHSVYVCLCVCLCCVRTQTCTNIPSSALIHSYTLFLVTQITIFFRIVVTAFSVLLLILSSCSSSSAPSSASSVFLANSRSYSSLVHICVCLGSHLKIFPSPHICMHSFCAMLGFMYNIEQQL